MMESLLNPQSLLPLFNSHPLSSLITTTSHRSRMPRGIGSSRRCIKKRLSLATTKKTRTLIVRASPLDGDTAAAAVAVSALAVAYFYYSQRSYYDNINNKYKNNVRQLVENQKSISAEETMDEAMQLQPSESISSPMETLITSRHESSDGVDINTIEYEVTSTSSPLPIRSESALPHLENENCIQENESSSDFSALAAMMQSNFASGIEGEKSTGEIELSESSSYAGILSKSGREGLHTFCGANRLAARSSHGPKTGKTTAKGVKVLSKKIVDIADPKKIEAKVPLAYYKEGSAYRSKSFRKHSNFPSEQKRRVLTRDGGEHFQHPSISDGRHVNGHICKEIPSNDKDHPSMEMSAYNRLLRNGRLVDCLELLEDMERKGSLDMDKIYHARFLKNCQSEKAVQEAFRFTKLIPNPTASTFNMLMSVCASSQDSEGAFQVLQLVQEAGLKPDCKLYTTLLSTCAKSGKVDAMFKVFHEMVSTEVEPNVHTYGALIDGCAKAGQAAKAFGAYGIMRSKNVKPDRVIFNALISACGQSGAFARAFDVLSEMTAEVQPIDPDHITIGALMKACANSGQVHRAREVYDMLHQYNIKGSPEVYTIAVNSCSETGDWEFACSVYNDMTKKGVIPDEMFFSAMIDAAGHAGKLDAAFEILQEAKKQGMDLGIISYSSLMGACSRTKDWEKALKLYEDIKAIELKPTVSTMNALVTVLCDGGQLQKALGILSEMKRIGLLPNIITYSILFVASEKQDDVDVGLMLFSQAKEDGVSPNLVMCRCLIAMCLRKFEKACTLGEPVLSFNGRSPQIDSKWTSLALMVYRETIVAGVKPDIEVVSLILSCLRLPRDASLRERIVENLGVNTNSRRRSNIYSLVDGFGEYDLRAVSLFEEAASFGIVPCVSFKDSPIVVDVRELPIHTAEVYLLAVLKGLKYRRAAGAKLPNTIVLLPVEKTQIPSPVGEKAVNIAGRVSQGIASLLRRIGLRYQGNESYGKIRILGFALKRWLQPKLGSPFSGKQAESNSSISRLVRGISHQQRNIRMGNFLLL